MLEEILTDDIKEDKMRITMALMDKDASYFCKLFFVAETTQQRCFHADLKNVKKTACQVSSYRVKV